MPTEFSFKAILKRYLVYEIRSLQNDYISVVRWQSTSSSSCLRLSLSSATDFRRLISNTIEHKRRPCVPGLTPAHGRWVRRAIRNTGLFRVVVSQSGPKPALSTEAVQLCVGTKPNLVLIRWSLGIRIREVVIKFYEKPCVSNCPSAGRRSLCNGLIAKRVRNMRSSAQPSSIGWFSQSNWDCRVKRGVMNQSACSRSCPVLNVTCRSMIVPWQNILEFRIRNALSFQISARQHF
jgi:hypothetical protein